MTCLLVAHGLLTACGGASSGSGGETEASTSSSATSSPTPADTSGSTSASGSTGPVGSESTAGSTSTSGVDGSETGSSSSGGLEPTDDCAHDVTLSLVDDRTAVVETTCKGGPCGPMHLALHRVIQGDDRLRLPTDEPPGLPEPIAVRILERDREVVLTQRETLEDTVRILEVEEDGPATVVDTVDLLGSECLTVTDVDGDGLDEIVSAKGYLSLIHYDPFEDAWVAEEVGGPYGAGSDDPEDLGTHAEGLAVGDIDGDGEQEIVMVIEGSTIPQPEDPELPGRILAYDFHEDQWHETGIDPVPNRVLQDVAVADFDGDGRDDIVVVGWDFLGVYTLEGEKWTQWLSSEQVDAERVVAGDIDLDGRSEFLTRSAGSSVTTLFDYEAQWTTTPFPDASFLDGMGFGVFGDESRPSFVVSFGSSTRIYWDGGWQTQAIDDSPFVKFDADFGDIDNDGWSEVLLLEQRDLYARDEQPERRLLFSSEGPNFGPILDSAMVGDVDHDEPGNPRLCGTAKTPACDETTFALVTDPDSAGPWRITAHAIDPSTGCDERSAVAIVQP